MATLTATGSATISVQFLSVDDYVPGKGTVGAIHYGRGAVIVYYVNGTYDQDEWSMSNPASYSREDYSFHDVVDVY